MSGEYGPDMEKIALEEEFLMTLNDEEKTVFRDQKVRAEEANNQGHAFAATGAEAAVIKKFVEFIKARKSGGK